MNRRQIIAASALAAAVPKMAAAQASPTPPGLTYAFSASITLGPVIELGMVGGVRKRTVPITGGRFAGPKIKGVIVNGGADWQSILPDGSARIHALYTLQADDGTMIGIDNPGIRRGPPEVLARLAAGENISPALYYFRTTPVFDVADGPHAWLKQNIFVGVGARHPDSVDIDYFQLA